MRDHKNVSERLEIAVKLRANYDHTYQYVRKNERALTYDIGYQIYQRKDSSYVYGFEVVQDSNCGCLGSGAKPLQFEGPRDEAEALVRRLIEQQIEQLPEHYESERFRNCKETDEGVVTGGWLIRRIFGYWPTFHDAQLLKMSLRQYVVVDERHVDTEMVIHHWGQDNPEWKEGSLHCKLKFLFEDVAGDKFSMEDVNVPNWIGDIRFCGRDDGRIDVDIDFAVGPSICLHCATVQLLSIEPYENKKLT